MSAKFKLKSVSKAAATLAGVKTIIIMMNTLCKHGSNFSRGTKFIIMKVVTHFQGQGAPKTHFLLYIRLLKVFYDGPLAVFNSKIATSPVLFFALQKSTFATRTIEKEKTDQIHHADSVEPKEQSRHTILISYLISPLCSMLYDPELQEQMGAFSAQFSRMQCKTGLVVQKSRNKNEIWR